MKNQTTTRTSEPQRHDRIGLSLPTDLLARIRADAERGQRPLSRQLALIARDYYARQDEVASAG